MPTEQWSGNNYVTVHEKTAHAKDRGRVKIVAVNNCNHVTTICATKDCVESWEIDYDLFFRRTRGGRNLASDIGKELNV